MRYLTPESAADLPVILCMIMARMKTQRQKMPALSAIVGIIIGVGVTAAAGSTLYYTFESQTDPFKSSSALDVRNLSAVKDEDLLRITATLRNNGQTRIDEITIDKILVSDITISQNAVNSAVNLTINDVYQASNKYVYNLEGLTDSTKSSMVSIPYGQSAALILEINNEQISESVNVSDRLTMTLRIKAGGDMFITDAFSARVKPG